VGSGVSSDEPGAAECPYALHVPQPLLQHHQNPHHFLPLYPGASGKPLVEPQFAQECWPNDILLDATPSSEFVRQVGNAHVANAQVQTEDPKPMLSSQELVGAETGVFSASLRPAQLESLSVSTRGGIGESQKLRQRSNQMGSRAHEAIVMRPTWQVAVSQRVFPIVGEHPIHQRFRACAARCHVSRC